VAIKIVELFGYSPTDTSSAAIEHRANQRCPFLRQTCIKTLNDGKVSGVCTVRQTLPGPVICCPIRLYADEYRILTDVSNTAFGPGTRLIPGQRTNEFEHDGRCVAVFGKRWGKELRLPNRGGRGYFVDWILARINADGHLAEFVAIEVQAIDTTGNYRAEREAYLRGESFDAYSKAGINWENVNKRILPQLIYKGHVLRLERLCQKGLFFVCPTPVYLRIRERLGGELIQYEPHRGSLTFRWYDLGEATHDGQIRELVYIDSYTTTVDQVALAFTSPSNLPPAGVYEQAIKAELDHTRRHG
jgi:Restriction endonuclease NotI